MKAFIYNLLSKGLFILLLLALAAGYYYRAELFPQFFDGEVTQADAVPATADSPAQADAETITVPLPAMPAASSEPAPATAEPDNAGFAPQPAATSAIDAPALQWPSAATTDAEGDSHTAQASGSAEAAADAPLLQARSAYWAGDLDGAVAAYQQAAASRSDDPDVHGELGNIYFSQGNWEKAADAYLAAGQALLARGDRAAAEHLLVVLQGLDQARARNLADALAPQAATQQQ